MPVPRILHSQPRANHSALPDPPSSTIAELRHEATIRHDAACTLAAQGGPACIAAADALHTKAVLLDAAADTLAGNFDDYRTALETIRA